MLAIAGEATGTGPHSSGSQEINGAAEKLALPVRDEDIPFLEFQVSPAMTYALGDINSTGIGFQASVFPLETLGLQVGYVHFSGADTEISDHLFGELVYRLADTTFEPYLVAGAGLLSGSSNRATLHVGGGLNFWVSDTFSVFMECRHTWVNEMPGDSSAYGDFLSFTIGGRISF